MEQLYKIILINLKKDKERLEYMTKQLNDLGLEFKRLEAVNGKEYMENDGGEYDEGLAIEKGGLPLKLGEIGCALSHKRCYERFLNAPQYKDAKYLLILEDDVELDKNFKNILEEEIRKNEENYKWDYLQFNYPEINYFLEIFKLFFLKFKWRYIIYKNTKNYKHKIINLLKLPVYPFFSIFTDIRMLILSYKVGIHKNFPKNPILAGAYLINKKIVKDLYQINKKIIYPADIVTSAEIYKNKNYNFYFYAPLVARQENEKFKSSIDEIEKR